MTDREQLITGLKESVVRELTEKCGKSEKVAKGNTRSIRLPLELETNGEAIPAWDREKPHYNRFLYRLKKFETYCGGPDGWLTVEEKLGKAAEDFARPVSSPGTA